MPCNRSCTCQEINFSFKIQARNKEFFRAGEFSRNQGTSINISSTTHERKAPQGKNMGFFHLETLKTTFKMRNLTQFFQNQGTFFQFLQKGRGDFPPFPPLVTHPKYLVIINGMVKSILYSRFQKCFKRFFKFVLFILIYIN